jgi:hypothetical protein
MSPSVCPAPADGLYGSRWTWAMELKHRGGASPFGSTDTPALDIPNCPIPACSASQDLRLAFPEPSPGACQWQQLDPWQSWIETPSFYGSGTMASLWGA